MNVEPEKIKALIDILQSMLVSSDEEQPEPVKSATIKTKPKKRKGGHAEAEKISRKPKFVNRFDSMPEKNLHKEDAEIDKKLCVKPPVPRARDFDFIDVTCRVCHRQESINPVLLANMTPDRYKCNKCSSSPG